MYGIIDSSIRVTFFKEDTEGMNWERSVEPYGDHKTINSII